MEALEDALGQGPPEIFNTDQGAQFTSAAFTSRVLDNIFIGRLWRSLKYEDIYLKDYDTVPQLIEGVTARRDFRFLQPSSGRTKEPSTR